MTIQKSKKTHRSPERGVHERQTFMSKTNLSLALSVGTIMAFGSLAACSGDDNGPTPVVDAAADQTSPDATSGTDGGTDAKADGAETSTPEAGPTEAGDAGPTEAGEAGPTEAGEAGPTEAGEAGPTEAGGEAGLIDAAPETGLPDALPDVVLDTGLGVDADAGASEAGLDGSADGSG
jgi:hypothetical protein